jgi:hypothetical protein
MVKDQSKIIESNQAILTKFASGADLIENQKTIIRILQQHRELLEQIQRASLSQKSGQ